ncbi:superfamily I DNA/RNA helicase [Salinibacter virus M31CR41-3]|nr:superfamily I DNA/RNA helicase [Salinibacter virus M31CR41-3]
MSFDWSPYQEDIFEFIENGTGDGIVEARAGAGKTTTLVEGAHRIPDDSDALFLAFNKHIEQELSEELEDTPMEAKTVHSCAYGVLYNYLDKPLDVNKWKYYDILDSYLDRNPGLADKSSKRTIRSRINRMLGLVRMQLIDPRDTTALMDLAGHYGVVTDRRWLKDLPRLLERGRTIAEFNGEIDFDGMVYLPVHWDLNFPQYDWVFVDEAQDLNAVQREIVQRSVRDDGRTMWVGDPKQAIYGFAGASTDSFEKISNGHTSEHFTLPITYRCPQSHVDQVHTEGHVEDIEARDDAPQGEVIKADVGDLTSVVEQGDYVLCRTNAPLIRWCIRFIEEQRKAVVLGRSLQKKLCGILTDVQDDEGGDIRYEELPAKLNDYLSREIERLMQENAPETVMNKVRDRIRCLKTCYEEYDGVQTVDELKSRIEALFSDEEDGVTFMTVHKAKGSQSERVHILRDDLLPLEWEGQKDWEADQERNLRYVAKTRATDTLSFLVPDGPDQPKILTA